MSSYVFSQFATLGGAVVKVTTAAEGDQEWKCLGCRDRSLFPKPEHLIRAEANDHAAICRALPTD
ncbi:hypothetical protein [Streptomyces sp. NPDC008139]|uniref:hypothetical protein n=1 Tax=Streptomyces sp. NPDC008139 TaxID=3364814 RepID=UPI0036E9EF48